MALLRSHRNFPPARHSIERGSRCEHSQRLEGSGEFMRGAYWFIPVVFLFVSTLASSISGSAAVTLSSDDQDEIKEGQQIFRYDTFGDEQQWTDRLRMHEVIESSIDPLTALGLGLKVDVEALPDEVLTAIAMGQVDLEDPATTLALIKLDAVVGIVGKVEAVEGRDRLLRVGVTCALCHSTVDDSFAPGIGRRLDGWPNVDLDPGAIIAASPAVPAKAKEVYRSWGPGKYDPRFNIDGLSTPLVLPPAYGLAGVDKETYTGDGSVSYWNRYVAVTQMGGQGSFNDPELGIHIVRKPDLVQRKLGPLRRYQFSLEKPVPEEGSFDAGAAARGEKVFHGAGKCATCHVPPLYTDSKLKVLDAGRETGMEPAYAKRTKTGRYRTTPLRGLATHAPYFHDGSAATLDDVVEHYDEVLGLELEEQEKLDLVEFLKSL
jgi:mono/diheme cytochrome c family protein